MRDEAACRGLANSIGRRRGLDLWVNIAGVFFSGPPWEQSADTRQPMLDVNSTGLMNGTIAALGPVREAAHGQIINVVPLAGIVAACLRMLPLVLWDARRKQRRYKKKIEAGQWP